MYSNCLIEAVKAKIKDPKNVRIHLISPKINNGRLHFVWINYANEKAYHYSALDQRPFWKRPLFKGKYRVMNLNVYEGYILHTLYKANFTESNVIKYVKKHHLRITEDDVREYFYWESNKD